MTSMPISLIFVARITGHTVLYVSVLALSGCASMAGVGGSAEFGCKAPVGVKCDSVSGTYYNALQQNLPSQQKSGAAAADASVAPTFIDQLVGKHAVPTAHTTNGATLVTATGTTLAATRAVSAPLRSPARVLRLWIKPWEDSDGDLHSQSYVYVPIDAGRWLIDHYHSPSRQAYAPIRAPRAAGREAVTPGTGITSDSPRASQDEALVLGARASAVSPASVPAKGAGDGQ